MADSEYLSLLAILDNWDLLAEPPTLDSEGSTDPAAPNRPNGTTERARETLSVHASFRLKSVPSIQQEFQMTIQSREKLGPRRSAILLTVCCVEAIEGGSDLSSYLALNFLLELNRSYIRTSNVNLDVTKKAIALAEATMISLRGAKWVGLLDRVRVTQEVREHLQALPWYPTLRTYRSWQEYYVPQRLLELRIVPLEQFLEHSGNTQPYSSYTKGYHESGRGYRRDGMVYGEGRTPFDPEIDEDRELEPVDLSSPIDEDPVYQSLCRAIQRAKERLKGTK